MNQNEIKNLVDRVEKLERAVFGVEKKKVLKASKVSNYSGPKGGTLLLIEKGYFDNRRTPKEVMSELESNGYNYQLGVVCNTLNRLCVAKGPLTRIVVDKKFIYVKRK